MIDFRDLMLRGRQGECAALDGLLRSARAGQSGVLVLHGEPGIGKTALLEYAIRSASNFTVLRANGLESEMEFAFGALHQVCSPLLDSIGRLPGPQHVALETTFGLRAGTVPDRFLVGLAVLGLISDAAQERPVLCIVDDAQWLDRASAEPRAFVARRLLAEAVVMLFATREPLEMMAGLQDLPVKGLGDDYARELLASVIPGRLDERVAEQLLAETRGNPLALLELPRGLGASQLAGGFGLPRAFSLQGRIEESFRQRLELLPSDTQLLLLVAAAEPLGDPALLWSAAERLGIGASARAPAESVGLLEINRRVRFRHPLVRSAVYETAEPETRRQVHRALAEATDPLADPERRAWHRAEAAAGPTEDSALELVRAAGHAQARGGLAAAAAFLERAAMLTADPRLQAERNLAAAEAKYEAGALDDALALLAATHNRRLGGGQEGQVRLLRAEIALAARRGRDAPPLLLEAARHLEPVDPARARTTYLEAISAAMFAGRFGQGAGVREVSEAALAAPSSETPGPSDLLLQGLAVRFTAGFAAGAPILKEALRAFRRPVDLPPREARMLWCTIPVALYLWDDDAWMALTTRQLDIIREAGAMTALPFVITIRSSVLAMIGELEEAASLEAELRATTEATGITAVPYGALTLAALRGHEHDFLERAGTMAGDAEARGEGNVIAVNEFLGGFLYNGLGRYDDAVSAVGEPDRFPQDGPAIWAMTELIEAAARLGQPERATSALELGSETTQASGTDWGLGIEAGCRAPLSEDGVAEALYREAIERLERSRIRVQHARAHLLY